ncbi:hypothetical protein B0J14DRAFT_317079 [Halenospora varia]|nr:hypothetical protein B0J14DRAFT_317079 [Halenospora varia]
MPHSNLQPRGLFELLKLPDANFHPQGIFKLLKLPLEIQTIIYELACVEDEPFQVLSKSSGTVEAHWEPGYLVGEPERVNRGLLLACMAPTAINLAATCKSIKQIVVNDLLLHKNNDFQFGNIWDFYAYVSGMEQEIIRAIGGIVVPVRKAEDLRNVGRYLQQCENLRTLTLLFDFEFGVLKFTQNETKLIENSLPAPLFTRKLRTIKIKLLFQGQVEWRVFPKGVDGKATFPIDPRARRCAAGHSMFNVRSHRDHNVEVINKLLWSKVKEASSLPATSAPTTPEPAPTGFVNPQWHILNYSGPGTFGFREFDKGFGWPSLLDMKIPADHFAVRYHGNSNCNCPGNIPGWQRRHITRNLKVYGRFYGQPTPYPDELDWRTKRFNTPEDILVM